MPDAVVVGSGPNGLAAAVRLARAGVSVTVLEGRETIGGGTRTSTELTVPGLVHDHCSAVHPMAVGSPFLRSLDLERHGLRWCWPEVDVAHPLEHGPAAVLYRSISRTAAELGVDGSMWEMVFGRLGDEFDDLVEDVMRPLLHVPAHPLLLARFAGLAGLPVNTLTRAWREPRAKALFAGVAAHAIRPFSAVGSAGIGVMLIAAGHRWGWPVAAGGSFSIAAALAAELEELGGRIETGAWVKDLGDLPRSDAVLLDVAPGAAVEICGQRLPAKVAKAYRRWQHGPAAFKVDLAVEGGVPWRDEACRKAGTVHVGGTVEEISLTEREVARGRMPSRPYVLVSQQYLADPARAIGTVVPVWAYAHVPRGWAGDATQTVLSQLERYAPGVRDRVVATHSTGAADFTAGNPNVVGGDILTGANTVRQSVARPRLALDPYASGIPGVFLCSAATPPGAGVHGMCGAGAAGSALSYLRRAAA